MVLGTGPRFHAPEPRSFVSHTIHRLRSCKIIEFASCATFRFRCGDLYHQHPEEDGYDALERESYSSADIIRQVMLARPLAKSNSSINRVKYIINASRIKKFKALEVEEGGPLGIETAKYGTAINDFLELAMNGNAVW
jgi:hypothetical protein